MLTKNDAKNISNRILDYSKADQTEIIIMSNTSALTRYANNAITQNVTDDQITVVIRVITENKTAKVVTNQYDDESLRSAIDSAIIAAKNRQEEKITTALLPAQKHKNINSYCEATAKTTPNQRAAAIKKIVGMCKKNNINSYGTFSTAENMLSIANSRKLFAFHKSTIASISCTASTDTSSGWAEQSSKDVRKLNPDDVARTAIEKALLCRNPQPIPAGRYTVILEPSAVANLTGLVMFTTFSGLAFHEGRSFMSGKLNTPITGEKITLIDDPFHPLAMGIPFDFEGRPKKKIVLVNKGVAKNIVYDRKTAKKFGKKPTGHTFPDSDSHGGIPLNTILAGGNSSIKEMIASTKKGLLVTDFHYTNILDPMKTIMTGMTRNGTFLIENGKITAGVKNLRFTENVAEAFKKTEMLTKTLYYTPAFFGGGFVVPAMKIADFNFSSETKF
ncbi:MAG: TldD/PmbA family protein [Planctomycetes bacterium]|nr:TldD/PmbA family protein [Planctomycetota bacterium]